MTLFVIFYPYYFVCYHFVLEPGNCPSWEGNCPGGNCPFPMYVSLHVLHTYIQCTYIIPTCTYLHKYTCICMYACKYSFVHMRVSDYLCLCTLYAYGYVCMFTLCDAL